MRYLFLMVSLVFFFTGSFAKALTCEPGHPVLMWQSFENDSRVIGEGINEWFAQQDAKRKCELGWQEYIAHEDEECEEDAPVNYGKEGSCKAEYRLFLLSDSKCVPNRKRAGVMCQVTCRKDYIMCIRNFEFYFYWLDYKFDVNRCKNIDIGIHLNGKIEVIPDNDYGFNVSFSDNSCKAYSDTDCTEEETDPVSFPEGYEQVYFNMRCEKPGDHEMILTSKSKYFKKTTKAKIKVTEESGSPPLIR